MEKSVMVVVKTVEAETIFIVLITMTVARDSDRNSTLEEQNIHSIQQRFNIPSTTTTITTRDRACGLFLNCRESTPREENP